MLRILTAYVYVYLRTRGTNMLWAILETSHPTRCILRDPAVSLSARLIRPRLSADVLASSDHSRSRMGILLDVDIRIKNTLDDRWSYARSRRD